MSGDHTHGAGARPGSRYRGKLLIVFLMVVVFMIVETVAAVISGSLVLLSDAGHMATDAIGVGMALAAIVAADNLTDKPRRTYGVYRLEVLAALANALLLFLVGGYVIYEAVRRLTGDPADVLSGPMFIIPRAWRLGRKAMRILVEAAPESSMQRSRSNHFRTQVVTT